MAEALTQSDLEKARDSRVATLTARTILLKKYWEANNRRIALWSTVSAGSVVGIGAGVFYLPFEAALAFGALAIPGEILLLPTAAVKFSRVTFNRRKKALTAAEMLEAQWARLTPIQETEKASTDTVPAEEV
jgi:hypothetical protein